MKLIWAIMVSWVFATQAIAADVQQRNPGIEGTIGAQIDAFLEDDFAGLRSACGPVVGLRLPNPRLIPLDDAA